LLDSLLQEHVKILKFRLLSRLRMEDSKEGVIEKISSEILSMVEKRGPEKSCCPSEIPRKLFGSNWREFMELTRYVAFHHAKSGEIEIYQKGELVKSESVKGAIRLKITIDHQQ